MSTKENEIIGSSGSRSEILERRRINILLSIDGQDADAYMSYLVFEDGGRYQKAYLNVSEENIDENTRAVTLLEFQEISTARYYYQLAHGFSWPDSKHILRVSFPDTAHDPPVVLVDEIRGFYDEWCETEIDYFQKCKNGDEALKILNKFLTILGGVVKGLVCLFKIKKYHGNLSDGIAINDDLNASLYNMRENGFEAFEDGIAEDIEELHDMISIWLSRGDEFVESKWLRRFQETLENKALMKDCNYIWAIYDAKFWDLQKNTSSWTSEKYKFMEALHGFIYGRRDRPKTLENCFCFDWRSLIPKQENDLFRVIYSKRTEDELESRYYTYTKNIDLVQFWHRVGWCIHTYRYSKPDVERARMEEVFNVTQECFSAVMSYLLQDSTTEEDVLYKAELKAALGFGV